MQGYASLQQYVNPLPNLPPVARIIPSSTKAFRGAMTTSCSKLVLQIRSDMLTPVGPAWIMCLAVRSDSHTQPGSSRRRALVQEGRIRTVQGEGDSQGVV